MKFHILFIYIDLSFHVNRLLRQKSRFFGNPHPVKDIALFTYDQRCHDFRCAGNQTLLCGICLKQNPSTYSIQYVGFLRRNSAGFQW